MKALTSIMTQLCYNLQAKLSIISQFLKYSLQYFGIKIIQALHVKSRTWIKLISYLSLRGNG